MYKEILYEKLKGRLFTKNSSEWPKFGPHFLKSENSLKEILKLEIGESTTLNNQKITRVQ